MKSIRGRLLVWLIVLLTSGAAVSSWAVYSRARAQAREVFDFELRQLATAFPGPAFKQQAPAFEDLALTDVVVRIWDASGKEVYVSHKDSDAPRAGIAGFASIQTPTGTWRVYSTTVRDHIVQVAQSSVIRETLAKDMALRAMLPIVALFPALIILMLITVARGLKPLEEIASAIEAQSADALKPVPEPAVPREVKPLVHALNQLLSRLDDAMRAQRSFIADAAHELRTPLAAVKVQIKLVERANSDETRALALARLNAGIDRATHLVQQLLTLARTEPECSVSQMAPLMLSTIAADVVSEQAPIADAKGVDLGLSCESDIEMQGEPHSIRILLGNLVDNAIRYTPPGGVVDVVIEVPAAGPRLTVKDNGSGISPENMERVFDRFFRQDDSEGTGSGLGLAIVQKIAQRHGAKIALDSGIEGKGLSVSVQFPHSTGPRLPPAGEQRCLPARYAESAAHWPCGRSVRSVLVDRDADRLATSGTGTGAGGLEWAAHHRDGRVRHPQGPALCHGGR